EGVRQILYGNGDGTFNEGTQSKGGSALYMLEVGDFNGDGLLDYVTSESGGNLLLYFNQGNDTFTEQTITPSTASTSQALSVADVTGDGILDIISGNQADELTVFEGDGAGNFSEAFKYTGLGGDVNDINLADVNNDGVLDILAGVDVATSNTMVFLGGTTSGVNPLLEFDLSTKAGALQALAPLEHKREQLSEQRGVIGAFQSRLESAVRTITSTKDNYVAAESRIRDADFAQETSEMIRLQILRNSSAAVLSQANLQPELTLQLLGV
ncbi:MAG: VCBS repeat-containing protein, partial [Bdellovibrionales bacterium]|nr:VCBS repeat-containing protein [Bdellovibrionales bacterium]